MIQGILFDNDGVIVLGGMFGSNMVRDFGFSVDELTPFFQGKFQECIVGKADLKEELAQYISEKQLPITVNALLDYWFEDENKPNIPLIEMIHALRKQGIKCYLATNQEKYRTEYLIMRMRFSEIFDHIFASYQLGAKKPSQEFFQAILIQTQDAQPSDLLLFDDTEKNVFGAREVGLAAELYTDIENFKQQLSDHGISVG